jgi:hypothetical protein
MTTCGFFEGTGKRGFQHGLIVRVQGITDNIGNTGHIEGFAGAKTVFLSRLGAFWGVAWRGGDMEFYFWY